MKNIKSVITDGSEETKKFAIDFAKSLTGGEILCLYGDLGFGKTTFIQGLAKGIGIRNKIISPTFIVMRSYKLSIKYEVSTVKYFYHVDLYRINNEQEIIDIGLMDIMNKPENVVAIEWPEKMGKSLPKKRVDITLGYMDENKRSISIKYPDVSIRHTPGVG